MKKLKIWLKQLQEKRKRLLNKDSRLEDLLVIKIQLVDIISKVVKQGYQQIFKILKASIARDDVGGDLWILFMVVYLAVLFTAILAGVEASIVQERNIREFVSKNTDSHPASIKRKTCWVVKRSIEEGNIMWNKLNVCLWQVIKPYTREGRIEQIDEIKSKYRKYDISKLENEYVYAKERLESHDRIVHYGICLLLVYVEMKILELLFLAVGEFGFIEMFGVAENSRLNYFIEMTGSPLELLNLYVILLVPLLVIIFLILIFKIMRFNSTYILMQREILVIKMALDGRETDENDDGK